MKKFALTFLLVGFVFTANSFAQKVLTLEEAISIALNKNTDVIKTRNNLETNRAQVKSAYGDLLPDFGLRGSWSWTRINDDGGARIIDFFGRETTQPASRTDSRNWVLSAGGNIVLFDGLSNLANINQKTDELEAAENLFEKLKQDIVYQTTELYYNVLNARELVKVRQDNLKFNKKLYEDIQERNKVGQVPMADVYTQQVQFGNAQLALIRAQNDYENAKSILLNFLALDVLENYRLEDPIREKQKVELDGYIKEFEDIESMVNVALQNRKDYISKKLSLSSAREGLTVAQSGLFPSLSGNYNFSTRASSPDDLFTRREWSLGLTLNIPIFSNWNTETAIQFAKIKIDNSMEDLNALERQIKIDIKQGYLDLVAAKKRLDVSTANVKAAEENRKINQERYNLGSGTILDVLQSDKDYTQALSDNINALYEYYKLRDKLLNSLGRVNPNAYEVKN